MTELPHGWTTATIAELIGPSGVFSDGDWVESKDQDPSGGVRLIQLADIGVGTYRNRSNRFLQSERAKALRCTYLRQDDILIARMPDPLGRACLFPGDAKPSITAVDVAIARVDPSRTHSGWLMWAINAPRVRAAIAALAKGTTRKRISRKNLAQLSIPVPPRQEQERIAAAIEEELSRIQVGEQHIERMRRGYRSLRSVALQSAVRGLLVPQDPTEGSGEDVVHSIMERRALEGRDGKPPRLGTSVAAPQLPPNWGWASIGALFDVFVGATPSRRVAQFWGGGVPWVSSGEVAFGRISSTKETISADAVGNKDTRLHPPGTVLLAMIGEGKTRGQTAILDVEAAHNQNCASIRVSATEILPEYVYWVLVQRYEATRKMASGGNQPALNSERVRAIELPVPPVAEQARIVEVLDELDTGLARLEAAGARATAMAHSLRTSVLSSAITGQLTQRFRAADAANDGRKPAARPTVRSA